MGLLSKLFGPKVDFADLVKQGARIVDVRTPAEFKGGHIKGSINIPLSDIRHAEKKLKGDKPIILICASGNRSGQALHFLKSHGFGNVYNGGGWRSFQRYV